MAHPPDLLVVWATCTVLGLGYINAFVHIKILDNNNNNNHAFTNNDIRVDKIMVESQNAESNVQNNKQGSQQLVVLLVPWWGKEKLGRSVKPTTIKGFWFSQLLSVKHIS